MVLQLGLPGDPSRSRTPGTPWEGTKKRTQAKQEVEREGELIIFVPRHLVLPHPERLDRDGVLRTFVLPALVLGSGAAHLERAAGDR